MLEYVEEQMRSWEESDCEKACSRRHAWKTSVKRCWRQWGPDFVVVAIILFLFIIIIVVLSLKWATPFIVESLTPSTVHGT